MYTIEPINDTNRKKIFDFFEKSWKSHIIVTKGKIHDLKKLNGFLFVDNDEIKGAITYKIRKKDCEIVSLDNFIKSKVVGTKLIDYLAEFAKEKKCKKLWVIITNDDIDAIKFYQKKKFDMVCIYRNSILKAREIKPQIPLCGNYGIPIKHEIEFEFKF